MYIFRNVLPDDMDSWRTYNEEYNDAYNAMNPEMREQHIQATFATRYVIQFQEAQKRRAEAQKRYLQKNNVRQVMVKFNRATDEKELFDYLHSKGNMQGYLKKLIREDMEKNC